LEISLHQPFFNDCYAYLRAGDQKRAVDYYIQVAVTDLEAIRLELSQLIAHTRSTTCCEEWTMPTVEKFKIPPSISNEEVNLISSIFVLNSSNV
jgi:hypothetical protein